MTNSSFLHQKLAFFWAYPSEQNKGKGLLWCPAHHTHLYHLPAALQEVHLGGSAFSFPEYCDLEGWQLNLYGRGQEFSLTKQFCLLSDRLPQKE